MKIYIQAIKSMQPVENIGYFEMAKLFFWELENDKNVISYCLLLLHYLILMYQMYITLTITKSMR